MGYGWISWIMELGSIWRWPSKNESKRKSTGLLNIQKRAQNIQHGSSDSGTPAAQKWAALSENERKFLRLSCTELTYIQIAEKMRLSPKTIDGYRESLFEKFKVKSRVSLVVYAIKNELVKMASL
jgi:DNA-binding CsgD family transcriptional regulator